MLAKTLVTVAFVSMAAASAFAQSAQPLLQFRQTGGMPAPGGIATHELTLLTDGTVTVKEYRFPDMQHWNDRTAAPNVSTYVLAKINNAKKLQQIAQTASELKSPKLIADPNIPRCEDAPSTTISVLKDGKLVAIAETVGCVPSKLENKDDQYRADSLAADIQGLERFAR